MTVIVNHVAQANGLLVSQFSASSVLQDFIGVFVEECQELEFAFQQIKYLTLLDFANGYQLDLIGSALNQARSVAQNDEDYKQSLRVKILINTADGTPDAAIRLIAAIASPTSIGYSESGVMSPNFTHNGTYIPNLITILRDIAPAGCGTIFLTQPGDSTPETG